MTGKEVYVDIVEVRPRTGRPTVAEKSRCSWKRRVSFRRAMKKSFANGAGFRRRGNQNPRVRPLGARNWRGWNNTTGAACPLRYFARQH